MIAAPWTSTPAYELRHCAGMNTPAEVNVFFPPVDANKHRGRRRKDAYAQAKIICAGCPVRVPCAMHGANVPEGVFGGLAPYERDLLQALAAS